VVEVIFPTTLGVGVAKAVYVVPVGAMPAANETPCTVPELGRVIALIPPTNKSAEVTPLVVTLSPARVTGTAARVATE